MSAEHGEISEIPGGEEIDSTLGIEPTMEPLQPRRTAATRWERQTRPHSPLPMLLPAVPVSIPDPQTPAPMPGFSISDPQTPAPMPALLPIPTLPHVPDPETPPTGILLNAPVINPATP